MTKLFSPYWTAAVVQLTTNPVLSVLVPDINEVPNEAWPKIWLEDSGTDDWSTKTEDGIRPILTCHIGSRYNGGKELRTICDAVHEALHDVDLILSDGKSVLVQYINTVSFQDADQAGKTRHTLMKFEFIITEG